jgi:transcriptional regulator with XRE-family HTH domain
VKGIVKVKTDFASILHDLRRENNLSQKKAADELGISQALLSHYENGVREPKMEFIVKTCEYYGVSTDYILGRTNEKSFDGKVALNCSNNDQRCNADAASLIISLLSDVDDEQLSSSAAKYISFGIYNVLAALCSPIKHYEPLFDAALKTAESIFMNNVRRVKADAFQEEKLCEVFVRSKYPEQIAAYDQMHEDTIKAMAGMTF